MPRSTNGGKAHTVDRQSAETGDDDAEEIQREIAALRLTGGLHHASTEGCKKASKQHRRQPGEAPMTPTVLLCSRGGAPTTPAVLHCSSGEAPMTQTVLHCSRGGAPTTPMVLHCSSGEAPMTSTVLHCSRSGASTTLHWSPGRTHRSFGDDGGCCDAARGDHDESCDAACDDDGGRYHVAPVALQCSDSGALLQPRRHKDESGDVPTGIPSSGVVLVLAFPLQLDEREKGKTKSWVDVMLRGRR